MSSISAAYGLSTAWGQAGYGISAVRPSSASHDSPGSGHQAGHAEHHDKIVRAEVTKRMADGDMIVVNISGSNVVSSRTYSPTNVNLATHIDYTQDQMRRVNNYRNNLDSILSGSFINVTA